MVPFSDSQGMRFPVILKGCIAHLARADTTAILLSIVRNYCWPNDFRKNLQLAFFVCRMESSKAAGLKRPRGVPLNIVHIRVTEKNLNKFDPPDYACTPTKYKHE